MRPRRRAAGRRRRRAARGRARRAAPCPGTPRAPPRATRATRGRGGSSARRARGSSRPTRRRSRARAAAARRPTARRPASRARPSRRRGSGRAAPAPPGASGPVPNIAASSTEPRSSSSASCCEKYAASTPWPSRIVPAVGSRRPSSVSSSVVLPEPFGPTSATCSPRSIANDAPSSRCLSPACSDEPFDDEHVATRARRLQELEAEACAGARPGACTRFASSFLICLTRDCACFAFDAL